MGFGWRLDGIDSIDYMDAMPTYALQLGGATYTVRRDAASNWYALEAPWLRITRAGSGQGDDWHVRTPDGTRYTFRQVQQVVECENGSLVTKAKTFMVTSITAAADDPDNGANPGFRYSVNVVYNEVPGVTYTRQVNIVCNGQSQARDYVFQALPTRITYNGAPNLVVEFGYRSREDLPAPCAANGCNTNQHWYYFTHALESVTLKVNGQVARRYRLTSSETSPAARNEKRLLLTNVQVFGKGGTESLPSVRFTYTQVEACQQNHACRLSTLDNGQGGRAVFTYEYESASQGSYKLTQIGLQDLVTGATITRTGWYSGWGETAGGYQFAIITHVGDPRTTDDDLLEKHWFYNERNDPIKGKWGLEYQTAHTNVTHTKSFDRTWRRFVALSFPPGVNYEDVRYVVENSEEFRYDENGVNERRVRRQQFSYALDHQNHRQFGNVTHLREYGADGVTLIRTVERWYYPSANIGNRLAEEKLWQGDVGGVCKGHRRFYYDNQSSHTAPPTKGLLTKVEAAETTCGSGFVMIEQNSYDPTWHNLTRRQNGRGYGTNYTYDSVFQTFVATERNDLNHTITTTYNSGDMVAWALGLPWQVTDVNNQTTTFTYDAFGRVRTVDRPLEASVDEEWVYSDYVNPATPRYVLHKVRDDVTTPANPESGYLATWTFYDGLGRELQSQQEAEEGNGYRLVSSRQYDGHGRLWREGIVYKETGTPGSYKRETWDTAPPLHTSYTYSWTGQLYEVARPDGSKERTFYRYLQTATVDANAHMTIVETDGLGRLIAAKQYTGTYTNGPDWGAVVYAGAQYEYDVADRLDRVILSDTTTIDPTYDLLGRKTQMTDPDMGTWTYAYDAAGNLIRQTDARGTTLCYEYDALNRLRYVREDQTVPKDCAGTLVWRVTHEYDTLNWQSVSNGIGRRNRLNDGSGTTTWTYDARGRVTKETKVIGGTGGGTFVTQWSYDALDRVATMTYPGGNNSQSGEIVTFTYNPQGLLERMYRSSPTPVYDYVGGTDYNALGQVTERRLGSATGVLRQRYEYPDTENYRLTTLQSGTAPHYNNRQNLSYTYDDVGNILSITDAAAVGGSQTQSFTYDALNRLKTAQATGGSYGVYSQQTYTYTLVGNIESFEGTAFGYNDAAHKHAVTHLNGVQKYWYDANGNMTRRINFGLNVTYSYDAENRLVEVSGDKTATFTYDGDGKLVKMRVGSTYVAIAGPHYQHSGSTGTKYYYAGSVRIAERIGGTLYYLLTDHLGSTAVTTDANGAYVTELRYMPYGKSRYNPGNQKADYRFTGQRWQNDVGLYYYNARWYDHLIGRFAQPDPLVPEPGNPQALNRYAYVLNNPLKYTDPTGHAACIDDLCDLVAHPATGRPILRVPAPRAITYIYKEMIHNAQSPVAQVIAMANAVAPILSSAKSVAMGLWGSQVMDARVKRHVGPLAPLLGNWDHKPILYPKDPRQPSPVPEIKKRGGYSTVGSGLYSYDIWSNIHYGYVGRATGFSQPELTGGAGVEQIGSDLYNRQWPHQSPGADNWLAGWDQPSDNAAIQIGIRLWDQYGLAVRPADLYLAVLEEPRLATLPLGGAP